MTTRGFLRVVWTGFYKVALPFVAVCGLALEVFELPATLTFSALFVKVVALLLLLAVCTLAAAAYSSYKAAQTMLPRVRLARKKGKGSSAQLFCLLDPSPLFGIGMAVSFYFTDADGFEVQVGLGKVETIQANGIIQVVLLRRSQGQNEVIERLAQDDASVLNAMRVKPFLPIEALAGPRSELDE
ncbi:MAG: hypothetical protein ACHQZS_07830 [Candidatus Binatales bacterium]